MKQSANLIGLRLKNEMKKRGVTSARLATEADVKTSFIYDVISGKSTNPSTVKLARVADSLGISLKSLVETGEPSSAPPSHSADYLAIPRLTVDTSRPETTIVTLPAEQPFLFSKTWVSQHLKIDPGHLRLLQIAGDSMEPVLCHGDQVLIDTSSTHPTPPGIFIIYDGYGLTPKRLELLTHTDTPRIRALSENPHYSIYEKSVLDMRIIGRVVWFARGI